MTSTQIKDLANRDYKWGFVTPIESDTVPPGLNEDIIRTISARKQEPDFMLQWRLKAYRHWLTMIEPSWANVRYPRIDYQSISYYAAPKTAKSPKSLDEVDPELLRTYEKLGIPLDEQKMMPSSYSFSRKVVATETESNTASTATPASAARSCSGTPSFS